MEIYNFNINDNPYEVKIISIKDKLAKVEVNGVEYDIDVSDIPGLISEPTPVPAKAPVAPVAPTPEIKKEPVAVQKPKVSVPETSAGENVITSPMPGGVVEILVSEGEKISVGDIVVTIEAMKMENPIRSTTDGVVSKIHVKEGDVVAEGAPLVSLGG